MFLEIYARYQAFPQIKHLRELLIGYFPIKRTTSMSTITDKRKMVYTLLEC